MFKRIMCMALALALSTGAAFAEAGVSAADALFSDGAAPQATQVPAAAASDADVLNAAAALFGDVNYDQQAVYTPSAATASIASGDGTDEDMYGADDTASANAYPTLQLGDSDGTDSVAYIVFLQNRLIELGYLNDAADGVYGENTQTAVREFQRSNGLQTSGIADPATQEKIYSDTSTLVLASTDNALWGSDTMRVQTALAQWGFMMNKPDGKMGDNTRVAIRNFKEYMTKIDPTFGTTPEPTAEPTPEPTAESVFGDMPVAVDERITGIVVNDGAIDDDVLIYVDGQREFQVYRQDVRNGDKGDEVMRVQKRLKNLGYVYSADGSFGDNTELALKYFQRKHGLSESGVADKQTQELLFSATAMQAEEYVFPYKIIVDISDQRVYIGAWNGEQYHDLVKKMKCSTGKDRTPTPTGTYQSQGKAGDEWYYFKEFNCYAKWATRIVGGILFHSITFNSRKRPSGSVKTLGRKASHGCIRLSIDDAKWIYDNCPTGTTVVIQD